MAFYGMDPEEVRDRAGDLDRAARELEEMMSTLTSAVGAVQWVGPDADEFRSQWDQVRSRSDSQIVPDLQSHRQILEENIEEQEQASSPGDGWFDGLMDWLGDTWDGITDAVGGAVDWLGDQVSSGLGWLGDRVSDGLDAIGGALSTAVDAVRNFEWPRFTEVVVDGLVTGFHGANALYEGLTGQDLHLADDGTGYADAPVPVTDPDSGFVPPSDLAAIISNTQNTYGPKDQGTVSMTVIGGDDPSAVIVNIPGTEQWSPLAGSNPLDLTGNGLLAGSQGTSAGAQATADAIAQLYEQHGIPPGTPLMLNGHSQGGMIASSLAADPQFASQYNVTNVMTYGSPVENYDVPAGVNQLNLQHSSDIVPKIDAGGSYYNPAVPVLPVPDLSPGSPQHTTVTLPDPDVPWGPLNIMGNHGGGNYQTSVETQLADPNSALSQYGDSGALDPFLTDDPGSVQHFTSDVHRQQ